MLRVKRHYSPGDGGFLSQKNGDPQAAAMVDQPLAVSR